MPWGDVNVQRSRGNIIFSWISSPVYFLLALWVCNGGFLFLQMKHTSLGRRMKASALSCSNEMHSNKIEWAERRGGLICNRREHKHISGNHQKIDRNDDKENTYRAMTVKGDRGNARKWNRKEHFLERGREMIDCLRTHIFRWNITWKRHPILEW